MADVSQINLPNGSSYNVKDKVTHVELTQAEYDALEQAGQVDLAKVYFITDGNAIAMSGLEVSYGNTSSGLSATNVQNAIDEVNSKIESVKDSVHTETLVAGQTTIKFYESSEIASTTLIELYADEFGVAPSNMEVVNNSGLSEYYVQVTFSSAFDHNISLMIKYSTNSTYDEV